MRVAIGLKAHSGWAVAVVIGEQPHDLLLIDRRPLELIEVNDAGWARQPYHAAEELNPDEAEEFVELGVKSAHRIAVREIKAEVERLRQNRHEIAVGAVLSPSPMPPWSTILFPEALANAAVACRLDLARIPEKLLGERARETFDANLPQLMAKLTALGKAAGPPWARTRKTPHSRQQSHCRNCQ